MDIPDSHLETLLAIADRGTFDAAAQALHLTPSAVSQRIRALESSVGRVLVQRSSPCRPTEAGEVLLRLARQRALLDGEVRLALATLGAGAAPGRPVELPLAINADSLSTWFRPVLAAVGTWPDVALNLQVEDQAYSTELLRRGEVLAAITSEPHAVQGCSVTSLGVMRYRPAATPEFAANWRHGRGYDWASMPVVNYSDKDDLQHGLLRARGVDQPRLEHRVPTSLDFLAAVRAGLGWGMVPELQLRASAEPDGGELVLLNSRDHVDVPLHWMRWRLDSPLLDAMGDEIARAAQSLRSARPQDGVSV